MTEGTTDKPTASKPVRLSLKVPAEVADTIKLMAKERNTTVTRVIRDAIETEQLLQDAKRKRARFFIEDENCGGQRELIIR